MLYIFALALAAAVLLAELLAHRFAKRPGIINIEANRSTPPDEVQIRVWQKEAMYRRERRRAAIIFSDEVAQPPI